MRLFGTIIILIIFLIFGHYRYSIAYARSNENLSNKLTNIFTYKSQKITFDKKTGDPGIPAGKIPSDQVNIVVSKINLTDTELSGKIRAITDYGKIVEEMNISAYIEQTPCYTPRNTACVNL